jgi:hypothetical protein
MNKIKVELPKGFMNVGVSLSNDLIANTNNSKDYDTLRFPLPKPSYKWEIHSYEGDNKIVNLIDKKPN